MELQTICNILILIGSVLTAVKIIFQACGKPFLVFKNKFNKFQNQKTQQICKTVTKTMMQQLSPKFQQLQQQNQSQAQSINKLMKSSRDMLREQILKIYQQNKDKKQLTIIQREVLDRFYEDYRQQGGNSHIVMLYEIMCKWQIVDNDFEGSV